MKNRLRSVVLLLVLMTACSTNSPTMLPSTSPSATEAKIPTATSVPSLLPTPTSMPNAVASTAVPAEGQPSSVCKSTTYCPQTDCRKDECLFTSPASPDYPVGIATVRGYYAQVKRTAFSETKLCDSFVIVGGSKEIIRSILSLIDEAGNGLYRKNELNQPVISLDLNVLQDSEEKALIGSTSEKFVDLIVLVHPPQPRSAPTCGTLIEILKVVGDVK